MTALIRTISEMFPSVLGIIQRESNYVGNTRGVLFDAGSMNTR